MNMEFLSVYNYLLDEHLRNLKSAAHSHRNQQHHQHHQQLQHQQQHLYLYGDDPLQRHRHQYHLQHLWQPWKAPAADEPDPQHPPPIQLHNHHDHPQQQPQHSHQPPQPHQQPPFLSTSAASPAAIRRESRHTNKELPTAKWRRERRIRLSAEYQSTSPTMAAAAAVACSARPLSESNSVADSPLDMSGKPPPPPYREPLPGSQFAHHLVRPSVITQAPKRGDATPTPPSSSPLVSPSAAATPAAAVPHPENSNVVRATVVAAVSPNTSSSNATAVTASMSSGNESISMIDPVIDEHFRRSLGADYAALFGNNRKPGAAIKPTPIATPKKQTPTQHQQLPVALSLSPVAVSSTLTPSSSLPAAATTGSSPAANIASVTPTVAHVFTSSAQHQQQLSPSAAITAVQPTITLPLSAIVAPTVRSPTSATSERRRLAEQHRQQQQQQQQQRQQQQQQHAADSDVGMSVDDHFAKALGGDTWKQLQRAESRSDEQHQTVPSGIPTSVTSRTSVKHEVME